MSDEPDEVEETEADEDVTETDEQATEETEVEEEPEGLQDGAFVRIGYTAQTADGGQLVDTTDPEVAEEEGVDDQSTFEPRVIVLGEGHLFPEVEDDIRGRGVGDEGSVVEIGRAHV